MTWMRKNARLASVVEMLQTKTESSPGVTGLTACQIHEIAGTQELIVEASG